MPPSEYEIGSSCLLGEVARLITDEVKDSIVRMIALANGQLLPADQVLPNAEHPTPNAARIYSRPPHQTSIEYIINRALGIPGAEIDYYETTESASEKLQGAKDREAGIDYSGLLINSEQQFVDALPMAIDRLMELAAGITVQRVRGGKPYTITRRPNSRAIEFIADRVAGRTGSILDALYVRFENPDTEKEYTREEMEAMTDAEKAMLKEALDLKEARASTRNHKSSKRPPSPVYGRRVGDEGYNVGSEGLSVGDEGYNAGVGGGGVLQDEPYELPDFAITANRTLKNFLPTAINHMKTLARGAQTIIETETERKVFTHEPEARANTFLINRFMGAPTAFIQIERIVEKTEYQRTMERLAAKYPEAVARFGSIQAALKAHAERTK